MSSNSMRSGWRGVLATVPAVVIAFLPNIACPACWPAYAGLLSALGVPVLVNRTVLAPLTALFLAVAVGALGIQAKRRRGYGPFVLGAAAALVVLIGKFVLTIDVLAYVGIVSLVSASIWNTWPVRRDQTGSCPNCAEPPQLGSN